MQGVVLTIDADVARNPRNHEHATREAIARRLAVLKGYRFGGEYDAGRSPEGHAYFVPGDTLVGIEAAAKLGIHDENDLFGAVVPFDFVATKTITHGLVDGHGRVPDGWSSEFARHAEAFVLRGFSAFTVGDALRATAQLLEHGPIRIKRAKGIGGRGQWVVHGLDELQAVMDAIDDEEMSTYGIVVEEHLSDVTTYSVGQVRVAGLVATYWGTQRLTPNNSGTEVYGGSELHVARGDFSALLEWPLADDVRLAITQARRYDEAAFECFRGMFGSRRNYDVVQGVDASGERRSGVLEQSWRLGGASAAEVGALEAFRDDPALTSLRATTVEVYGASDAPPANAVVYFRGIDERVGPLTKYAIVDTHGHAR